MHVQFIAVQECNNYQLCKRLCGNIDENLESTCAEGYTLSGECEVICKFAWHAFQYVLPLITSHHDYMQLV